MSGAFESLCRLFCCPPRPSHIVAKLAFLPPRPTYAVVSSVLGTSYRLELNPESGCILSPDDLSKITAYYATTRRNSRIVCIHIDHKSYHLRPRYVMPKVAARHRQFRGSMDPSSLSSSCPTLIGGDHVSFLNADHSESNPTTSDKKATYTLLFSHGNAVDLGQMVGFLQSLALRFDVNVFSYDYSGYGASTGERLEENLYADADAALTLLMEHLRVPSEQIVLYGQSIGTAPTVELAIRYKVAGIILHSPLMSGFRVVWPGTSRTYCFDAFANVDKVHRILSPTLIIHGTDDEVVSIRHGRELYSRLRCPLEPAWVDGAGHNDVEQYSEYVIRLDKFFNEDLASNVHPVIDLPESSEDYSWSSSCTSMLWRRRNTRKANETEGPLHNAEATVEVLPVASPEGKESPTQPVHTDSSSCSSDVNSLKENHQVSEVSKVVATIEKLPSVPDICTEVPILIEVSNDLNEGEGDVSDTSVRKSGPVSSANLQQQSC